MMNKRLLWAVPLMAAAVGGGAFLLSQNPEVDVVVWLSGDLGGDLSQSSILERQGLPTGAELQALEDGTYVAIRFTTAAQAALDACTDFSACADGAEQLCVMAGRQPRRLRWFPNRCEAACTRALRIRVHCP